MRKNSFSSLSLRLRTFYFPSSSSSCCLLLCEKEIEKLSNKNIYVVSSCRLASVLSTQTWTRSKKGLNEIPKKKKERTHVTLISSTRRVMRGESKHELWHWNRKIIIKHQRIQSTRHFYIYFSFLLSVLSVLCAGCDSVVCYVIIIVATQNAHIVDNSGLRCEGEISRINHFSSLLCPILENIFSCVSIVYFDSGLSN